MIAIAATAVVLAQYAGAVSVLDTTTVRLRFTRQTTVAANATRVPDRDPGVDLANSPSARIQIGDRRTDYTLSYSPTITFADIQLGLDAQILHFASASAAWHDRLATVALTEGASYGQLNSKFLYQAPASPGQTVVLQPAPAPVTILYVASATDLAVGLRAWRRVQLSASIGYSVSGGLDEASRAALPEQYGPRGGLSVSYALSHVDDLVTSAAGALVYTIGGQCTPPAPMRTCRVRTATALFQQLLRRRLSPVTTFSIGGGVGLATVPDTDRAVVYPAAFSSLSHQFGPRGTSSVTFSLQLAPVVDARTGFASERLQTNVSLTQLLTSALTFRASAGALQTIPTSDPNAVTVFMGSIDADYRLSRLAALTVGVQGLWQDQPGYGTLFSAFSYVAFTIRAPPIRL